MYCLRYFHELNGLKFQVDGCKTGAAFIYSVIMGHLSNHP